MFPKWSLNAPKWGPDGLWSPLEGRERFRTQIFSENAGHFGPKIGPKLLKNRTKIKKILIPKPTLNSMLFFDRFLIKF